MKKYSVQFFATPDELFNFVSQMLGKTDLQLLVQLTSGDVVLQTADRVILEGAINCFFGHYAEAPHKDYVNTLDFEKGIIQLRLGRRGVVLDENSLIESQLWFAGENTEIAKEAGILKREVSKMTTAGVIFKNPKTGGQGLSKSVRYTAGAAALARTGIILRPLAGNNEGSIPVG